MKELQSLIPFLEMTSKNEEMIFDEKKKNT